MRSDPDHLIDPTKLISAIAAVFRFLGRLFTKNQATIATVSTKQTLENLLQTSQKPLTNNEVAKQLGISPSKASRQTSKLVALGAVERKRVGREVAISLRKPTMH